MDWGACDHPKCSDKKYRSREKLIHHGLYYRLHDPQKDTEAAAWCFVSEDQKEIFFNVVSLNAHGNAPLVYIRCRGLLPDAVYRCTEEKRHVKPWTGSEPRKDRKQMAGRGIYRAGRFRCGRYFLTVLSTALFF